MKKTIIFAATVIFAFAANAQVKTYFGVKAGMNASELHGYDDDAKTKIGFHVGALAHIHGNSNWAFQPEIIYSLEGAKREMIPNGTVNTNLSYINVPLLVQYMFHNGFRIEAGPEIGFLMSATEKGDDVDIDIKDSYKSTSISLPVGIGYLTRTGLGFDARYNFGLTDINENGPGVKGNTFQFGIFWQFGGPKI